jgi:hypothetical protein
MRRRSLLLLIIVAASMLIPISGQGLVAYDGDSLPCRSFPEPAQEKPTDFNLVSMPGVIASTRFGSVALAMVLVAGVLLTGAKPADAADSKAERNENTRCDSSR